jgi:hypothetical protein
MRVVVAPFTRRQVRSLNAYQRSAHAPVMCRNALHGPLVAGAKGWRCETCTYRQTTAERWQSNFDWKLAEERQGA